MYNLFYYMEKAIFIVSKNQYIYIGLYPVRKKLLSWTIWKNEKKYRSRNLLCLLVSEKYELYDQKNQSSSNFIISLFILLPIYILVFLFAFGDKYEEI